jgi:hypothetical protein
MSDLFTPDGKLSVSALRQLGSIAEGTRRHIAGSGSFYTAPQGAFHVDAPPQSATDAALVLVNSAKPQEIQLQDGSKGVAYPAVLVYLQQGGFYANDPPQYVWFVSAQGSTPPNDSPLAVQLANSDVNGVPVYVTHFVAVVLQITGDLQEDGTVQPLKVNVPNYGTILAYPAQLNATVQCWAYVVNGETPTYGQYYLGVLQSGGAVPEENTGDQLPAHVYSIRVEPSQSALAFVAVFSADLLTIELPNNGGTVQGYRAQTYSLGNGGYLPNRLPGAACWFVAGNGQVPPNDAVIAAQKAGEDADGVPIYGTHLLAAVVQVQGVLQTDGTVKTENVLSTSGTVACYPAMAGVLVGDDVAPAVPCWAMVPAGQTRPNYLGYYLGVLVGLDNAPNQKCIYAIEAALTGGLPPFQLPPLPPGSPPPIIYGPPYPPIFQPTPPGQKPPPGEPPIVPPSYLIWTLAFNLYEPGNLVYPLMTIIADNNEGTAAFGRIVWSQGPIAGGLGIGLLDWQGFSVNLFSTGTWVGPGSDIGFENSWGVSWGAAEATINGSAGLLLVEAQVHLPWNAFYLAGDFELSPDWKTVTGLSVALEPGGQYQINVQLNGSINPSYAEGDYISCRLFDGEQAIGAPIAFCFCVCQGITFIDAASLTWGYSNNSLESVTITVQAKVVAGGNAAPSAFVLGAGETTGSAITATRVG